MRSPTFYCLIWCSQVLPGLPCHSWASEPGVDWGGDWQVINNGLLSSWVAPPGMSPTVHYDGVLHHRYGEQQPSLAPSFLALPPFQQPYRSSLVLSQTPSSKESSPLLASNLPAALGWLYVISRSLVRGRVFVFTPVILSAGQGWTSSESQLLPRPERR